MGARAAAMRTAAYAFMQSPSARASFALRRSWMESPVRQGPLESACPHHLPQRHSRKHSRNPNAFNGRAKHIIQLGRPQLSLDAIHAFSGSNAAMIAAMSAPALQGPAGRPARVDRSGSSARGSPDAIRPVSALNGMRVDGYGTSRDRSGPARRSRTARGEERLPWVSGAARAEFRWRLALDQVAINPVVLSPARSALSWTITEAASAAIIRTRVSTVHRSTRPPRDR
jgi:hypothetical protein